MQVLVLHKDKILWEIEHYIYLFVTILITKNTSVNDLIFVLFLNS